MKNRLQAYRQSRDDLLTGTVTDLAADERFVAAWLTGSYGRNASDEVSDLDIKIVVAQPHGETLCTRMQQLRPRVVEFTESEPFMPVREIETLFSLAKN